MSASIRERFDRFDVLVTILVFGDLVASALLGPEHSHALRWLLLSSAVAFCLSWWVGRFFRVSRLVHDVRNNFTVHDNHQVWSKTTSVYQYLGISGNTMRQEFQSFIETARLPMGHSFQLLLMRPFSDSVRVSKDHELGRSALDEAVAAVSRQIEESALFYKGLRARGLNIEVRFYSEYTGYWAHLVDNREVLVAHLMKAESGLHATVLHFRGSVERNVLLRFYVDDFERLWNSGEPVDKYFAKKSQANTTENFHG